MSEHLYFRAQQRPRSQSLLVAFMKRCRQNRFLNAIAPPYADLPGYPPCQRLALHLYACNSSRKSVINLGFDALTNGLVAPGFDRRLEIIDPLSHFIHCFPHQPESVVVASLSIRLQSIEAESHPLLANTSVETLLNLVDMVSSISSTALIRSLASGLGCC